MVGDDIPFFLLHLDHLSRRIRLEAFDAVTGKVWIEVSDDEYVTRNSTPGGFFAFAWDGTTFHRQGQERDATTCAERSVRREGVGPQGAG